MTPNDPGLILCLGGHDPSGAAGLLADARMIQAQGDRAWLIPTLDTAQNRTRFSASRIAPLEWLQRQWQTLFAEATPSAIKIGALAEPGQARWLAAQLEDFTGPVVIDPVLSSSSGGQLGDLEAIRLLARQATLLTPNREEANQLFGVATDHPQWLADCPAPLLVTGADNAQHHKLTRIEHLLLQPADRVRFTTPLLPGRYRGSGCLLASAVSCALARGLDLPTACEQALNTVSAWLGAAHRFDDGIHLPQPPT